MGRGRQDGLRALARVAAPDAAYVQARADADALQGGVTLFTLDFVDVQESLVLVHVEGGAGQHGAVLGGELHDVVVEAGDGDAAVGVVQAGDHRAERVDRVRHRAAVVAGVEVLVRAGDGHFQIGEAAHAAVDGRDLLGDHRGVGHEDDIGLQEFLVLLRPGGQRRTAHFLFALEDELHVMPQETLLEQELEGLQVHEQLALVVVRAAGVDGFLPGGRVLGEDRLERIGAPLLQRLRRLHVVVAVHEHRLRGAGHGLDAVDDGVALGLVHGSLVGAGRDKQFRQAAGAAVHVGLVFRLRADGGDAQQGEKLLEEAFAVLFDIGFHLVSVFHKNSKNHKTRRTFENNS